MKNIHNIHGEKCEACGQPLTNNHDAKHHHNEYMKNQKIQNKPLSDAEKHAEFMKTDAGIAMAKQLEDAKPLSDAEKHAEFMKTDAGIAMAKNADDSHVLNEKKKLFEQQVSEFEKNKEKKDNAEIISLTAKLAEAKAKKQRDNELKGEILEDRFEDYLNDWFQDKEDKIIPIAKGKAGGDVIQEVIIGGKLLNKIKLECKNKKTAPGQSIIDKLRNDMILHKALYGVLVTSVIPKDFESPYITTEDGMIYTVDANEPDSVKMVIQMLRNLIKGSYDAVRNLPSAQKEVALTKWATSDHTRALLRKHLQTIKSDHDGIVSDETNQKKRIKGRRSRNDEMRESITDLFTPLSVMESTKDINLLAELDDDAE